ncbi:MAG: VOC family protein [Thermoanaerobaculia bacterium]|nr:MAG: VOC family protein [Thermoanaerobaculia bacterium]
MSRIVHFEIHATEPQALIGFYTALFGWKFEKWGEVDYWLISTGPREAPGIDGGLLPRRGPRAAVGQPVNAYVCTVEVESLDGSFARAQELGAGPAVPKMAIPGVGWLAYVQDPDGNILGLMQPDPAAK